MSMIDLAERSTVGTVPESSSDVFYPTIYIEGKDLPFDKDDVGDVMKAEVVVKLKSVTTTNVGAGDRTTHNFEVRKIDFGKNEEAEDFTRGRVETKRKAGG